MTTTEASVAPQVAASGRSRKRTARAKRRRPAEASRVLAAGAGTAAVLTMVTAMAQADQATQVVERQIHDLPVATVSSTVNAPVSQPSFIAQVVPAQEPVIQTITVARPVRAQVSNARTSASR